MSDAIGSGERAGTTGTETPDGQVSAPLAALLRRQREDFLADGPPGATIRRDRLDRAIAMLVDNREAICDALAEDFGHRSRHQSLISDVFASVEALKHARRRVRRWMRPERRRPQFPLGLLGARARVHYQPLGVVGVVAPWNFPVLLTMGPLAGILAAGNRAMIKPSELTPTVSGLMARMVGEAFDEREVAVVEGGVAVAEAFTALPFDHLIFTGGTGVARHVMRAAAGNLVPVTLELGGKSPVIVGRGADMARVATSVMLGKTLNAGQVCLAPDYVLVPGERLDEFVAEARAAVTRMFPTLRENPDYSSLLGTRNLERQQAMLEEARSRGARVVPLNPAEEDFSQQPAHKMPPTLVIEPADDLRVMREEIFGPLLPVKSYRTADEAIDRVNAGERPLALYYFGDDAAERRRVLERTTSGGVCVNDTAFHVTQENLPFGGVGASGMGAYHGRDGFRTFSHARAVYVQSPLDITRMLRPPHGPGLDRVLGWLLRR